MNRERAPEIWWSRQWGLIWSDDGHVYRRVEDGREVEFLHLPRHAVALHYGAPVCGCEVA